MQVITVVEGQQERDETLSQAMDWIERMVQIQFNTDAKWRKEPRDRNAEQLSLAYKQIAALCRKLEKNVDTDSDDRTMFNNLHTMVSNVRQSLQSSAGSALSGKGFPTFTWTRGQEGPAARVLWTYNHLRTSGLYTPRELFGIVPKVDSDSPQDDNSSDVYSAIGRDPESGILFYSGPRPGARSWSVEPDLVDGWRTKIKSVNYPLCSLFWLRPPQGDLPARLGFVPIDSGIPTQDLLMTLDPERFVWLGEGYDESDRVRRTVKSWTEMYDSERSTSPLPSFEFACRWFLNFRFQRARMEVLRAHVVKTTFMSKFQQELEESGDSQPESISCITMT